MKKVFSYLLLITILFLSACNITTEQDINTSAEIHAKPDTTSADKISSAGKGSSLDSASVYGTLDEKSVQYFFDEALYRSRVIIEGTVISKRVLSEKEICYGETAYTWERYTFTDLEVISGHYERDTFEVNVIQGNAYYVPYEIGKRYITFASSADFIGYPYDDPFCQNQCIYCKMNDRKKDKIEQFIFCGYETERYKTREDLMEEIRNTVGIQNDYYNELDRYCHSTEIADIADYAQTIAKVRINSFEESRYGTWAECICTLNDLYKGEIHELDGNIFELAVLITDDVKAGEEYLIFSQMPLGASSFTNMVVAKKNAVIPMDDTERVNEVYAALGIEPEE